jgi:hypothetical protein
MKMFQLKHPNTIFSTTSRSDIETSLGGSDRRAPIVSILEDAEVKDLLSFGRPGLTADCSSYFVS